MAKILIDSRRDDSSMTLSRPQGCNGGDGPLHYLVYIKRRLGTGRRGVGIDKGLAEVSLNRPAGHGFGQKWLYDIYCRNRERGVVVWLFSVVRHDGWVLPPSLDACFSVRRAFTENEKDIAPHYIRRLLDQYCFAFEADSGGAFYLPWNSVAGVLSIVFPENDFDAVSSEVAPASVMAQRLLAFQTPRRLDDQAVSALQRFVAEIKGRPRCFISYRRADAPLGAMQLAARLFHHCVTPWWDQWAMPRTIAEETAMLNDGILNRALNEAIEGSPLAASLLTRYYATERSPWTRAEERRIHEKVRGVDSGQGEAFQHIRIDLKPSKYSSPDCLKKVVDSELSRAGLTPAGEVDQYPSEAKNSGAALSTCSVTTNFCRRKCCCREP